MNYSLLPVLRKVGFAVCIISNKILIPWLSSLYTGGNEWQWNADSSERWPLETCKVCVVTYLYHGQTKAGSYFEFKTYLYYTKWFSKDDDTE